MTKYRRDEVWDATTWAEIDQAVTEEAARVRVGRRVVAAESLSAADGAQPSWVSIARTDDSDQRGLCVSEGDVAPLTEISVRFYLTRAQVDSEGAHHTGRTLARSAAKFLALTEDVLLFGAAPTGKLRELIERRVITGASVERSGRGIVTEAGNERELTGTIGPEELAREVTQGIAQLRSGASPSPYGLILGAGLYGTAFDRMNNGCCDTAADRLRPQLEHFLGSQAVANDEGVLVSLAGDPVTLYVATDATAAYMGHHMGDDGAAYEFRVFERVQFVIRDPTSILVLRGRPGGQPSAGKQPAGKQPAAKRPAAKRPAANKPAANKPAV